MDLDDGKAGRKKWNLVTRYPVFISTSTKNAEVQTMNKTRIGWVTVGLIVGLVFAMGVASAAQTSKATPKAQGNTGIHDGNGPHGWHAQGAHQGQGYRHNARAGQGQRKGFSNRSGARQGRS